MEKQVSKGFFFSALFFFFFKLPRIGRVKKFSLTLTAICFLSFCPSVLGHVAVMLGFLSFLVSFIMACLLLFFFFFLSRNHVLYLECLQLGVFITRDAKLQLYAFSDVISLDTVCAETTATPVVYVLEDRCLYCHNSTGVIGTVKKKTWPQSILLEYFIAR